MQKHKKKLDSVLKADEILNKKSFIICTGLLAVMGFVVGFTKDDLNYKAFIYPYICLCLGFLVAFLLLLCSIKTNAYYGNSFKPSQILSIDKYYLQNKTLLIGGVLLNWYDHAIQYNITLNNKKSKYINWSLIISFSSLLIFVMWYIVLKIKF